MKMQEEIPGLTHEFQDIFEAAKGHLLGHWAVLAGMIVLCGIVTTLLLRNVAKGGR